MIVVVMDIILLLYFIGVEWNGMDEWFRGVVEFVDVVELGSFVVVVLCFGMMCLVVVKIVVWFEFWFGVWLL